MQVIDAVAFKSKTTTFQIFRMAESASVPLQLQSVALLRGGFKRFVRARGEEEKGEKTDSQASRPKKRELLLQILLDTLGFQMCTFTFSHGLL